MSFIRRCHLFRVSFILYFERGFVYSAVAGEGGEDGEESQRWKESTGEEEKKTAANVSDHHIIQQNLQ